MGQRLGVGSVPERPGGVCPWLWGSTSLSRTLLDGSEIAWEDDSPQDDKMVAKHLGLAGAALLQHPGDLSGFGESGLVGHCEP